MNIRNNLYPDTWDYEYFALNGDTVFEEKQEPVFSGLYDYRGVKLYKVPQRKIGFKFYEHNES